MVHVQYNGLFSFSWKNYLVNYPDPSEGRCKFNSGFFADRPVHDFSAVDTRDAWMRLLFSNWRKVGHQPVLNSLAPSTHIAKIIFNFKHFGNFIPISWSWVSVPHVKHVVLISKNCSGAVCHDAICKYNYLIQERSRDISPQIDDPDPKTKPLKWHISHAPFLQLRKQQISHQNIHTFPCIEFMQLHCSKASVINNYELFSSISIVLLGITSAICMCYPARSCKQQDFLFRLRDLVIRYILSYTQFSDHR